MCRQKPGNAKKMALFYEIVGWVGSGLVVLAYLLNLRGVWSHTSAPYLWANVVGGLCLIVNTLVHGAYPSTALNVVWVVVAVPSLLKGWRSR